MNTLDSVFLNPLATDELMRRNQNETRSFLTKYQPVRQESVTLMTRDDDSLYVPDTDYLSVLDVFFPAY